MVMMAIDCFSHFGPLRRETIPTPSQTLIDPMDPPRTNQPSGNLFKTQFLLSILI